MKKSQEELQEKLNQQLRMIHGSIGRFDSGGEEDESLFLATKLRILLYDNNPRAGQGSLLGQLGIKDKILYYDSALEVQDGAGTSSSYNGLVNIFLGENIGVYPIPMLDNNTKTKKVDFDLRRNGVIFIDMYGANFTRKDIVLFLADNEGGTHLDGKISGKDANFTKKNSLGVNVLDGREWKGMKGLEYIAVRQITHEILKSLDEKYTCKGKWESEPGYILGGNVALGFNPKKKVHLIFSVGGKEYSCPFLGY